MVFMRACSVLLFLLCALSASGSAQAPSRFSVAVGHALPTKAKFGFYPTVRGEWYVTSPERRAGILLDAYAMRAFRSATRDRSTSTVFSGTELGIAASAVLHAYPTGRISPYLVTGILGRRTSRSDSVDYGAGFGVSAGTTSVIEPNVGFGIRAKLGNGRSARLEVRYYRGMVAFPITLGMTL